MPHMVRLLPWMDAQTWGARGRLPEWPLSARHHAGLLHPSRPCPPRDHPPSGSIGPYLVIRPAGRTWRSSHATAVLLSLCPRALPPGNGLSGSDPFIAGVGGRMHSTAEACEVPYLLLLRRCRGAGGLDLQLVAHLAYALDPARDLLGLRLVVHRRHLAGQPDDTGIRLDAHVDEAFHLVGGKLGLDLRRDLGIVHLLADGLVGGLCRANED